MRKLLKIHTDLEFHLLRKRFAQVKGGENARIADRFVQVSYIKWYINVKAILIYDMDIYKMAICC